MERPSKVRRLATTQRTHSDCSHLQTQLQIAYQLTPVSGSGLLNYGGLIARVACRAYLTFQASDRKLKTRNVSMNSVLTSWRGPAELDPTTSHNKKENKNPKQKQKNEKLPKTKIKSSHRRTSHFDSNLLANSQNRRHFRCRVQTSHKP